MLGFHGQQHQQTGMCTKELPHGPLRGSEIIALKVSDVVLTVVSEVGDYTKVRVRRSKTDQAGRGADVMIADMSNHP